MTEDRGGGEGGEGPEAEGKEAGEEEGIGQNQRVGQEGREGGAAAAVRRASGITVSAPAEEGARPPASARRVFGLDKRRTEAPQIDCENQR